MDGSTQASLSITNSQSLLNFMSIESVTPSNHLILCHPFSWLQSFPALGSFPVSQFFASGEQKYWSFSFSISPSNVYSGLISFRIDWFDLLAVQGTLKSLLQHHSSEASILWHLAFFMVQLSHPYMTTGKTIALTRQTFSGKVMSLLFTYKYLCLLSSQDYIYIIKGIRNCSTAYLSSGFLLFFFLLSSFHCCVFNFHCCVFNSLIFSSVVSNLLLVSSSVFFILEIVFFLSRSVILIF